MGHPRESDHISRSADEPITRRVMAGRSVLPSAPTRLPGRRQSCGKVVW